MDKIIEVKNLKKSYGHLEAVKDMNFYVEKGKLFAFLGPNGAGKSTTINTICTFLEPDSGEVRVNGYLLGKEDNKIRSSIGAVFQESLLDGLLTVEENLKLRGSFYGLTGKALKEAIGRVAKETGIDEILKRPYGKLSGGQRRRCDIARALIHTPKILFLDEPTTGLDPQTRRNVWETIKRLQKENNMTVFLTTHYMEEAEEADYIIVVDGGEITAQGTSVALKERYASDTLMLTCDHAEIVCDILKEIKMAYEEKGNVIQIKIPHTMASLKILELCKDELSSFTVARGTMDDVFIEITGKELRE